ncbi:MAG: MnhB domain-containing protein [Vicinamibacterales bacterium]
MPSIVFTAFSRILFGVMMSVSLFILYRGHNEPGGGFVGGLLAASAFVVVALAEGVRAARHMLAIDPTLVSALGLACALASGLPGLLLDQSFLSHQWISISGIDAGTPLAFDLGVYLVVLGGVLSFILGFYEGD